MIMKKNLFIYLLFFFFFFSMIPNSLFINDVVVSADEIVLNEPYNIWFAPEHSFGTDSMKEVNWSFFQGFFQDHFYKNCMYKRYSYSSWTNGNQYVSIGKSWNDSGFWKLWINLSVPVNLFEVNVSFGCDREVLSFFEKDNYELWFNYSVPNSGGEVYCVMLNYSDIAGVSGVTFSKHCENNVCWVSIHKNTVPAGFYSFDPTFGYTYSNSATMTFASSSNSYIRGFWAICPSNGTAYSISFKTGSSWDGTGETVIGYIYQYVDYATDYAGNQLGITFETSVTATNTVYELLMNGTCNLVNGTKYYIIMRLGTKVDSDCYAVGNKTGTFNIGLSKVGSSGNPPTMNSPLTSETSSVNEVYIYCTYNETTEGGWSNTCPVVSNVGYANHSVDVCLKPTMNVTITDLDGNSSTVSWLSNVSGSWITYQVNSSVLNTTVYWNFSQANTGNTRYWWNITVQDLGGCNNSYNYYFNTVANYTPPSPDYDFSVATPNPANKSEDNPLTGGWCIQINQTSGEVFNWNISIIGIGYSSDTGSSNGTKCYAYSLLVCGTNYTVTLNLSLPRGNWTNYSFWFWTIDCVYCPSSSFNYSNLSIILYFDLFSQNGSFNFTIETNSSLRISQTWAVNGTYSIILYNITLGANYTVWVNQTVLNSSNIGCYYNKTYYYEVYNGSSSGVDNMDVTIYLNAETIGIILFFIMMILSYKWESSVFCYFVSIMALVMGIYFIGFYFAMFGTLLGIIFILLSPYFAFLGYHFGYSKGGIGK